MKERKNMYKAGFVGLIGQPNAGKSTLMNALVQEKVSIVSAKPQTTRRRMLGVVTKESGPEKGQVVFVDAPGIIQAEKGLNGFLAIEAKEVMEDSDFIVAVLNVDAKSFADIEKVIELVLESRKPWMAVINKVDMAQLAIRGEKIKEVLRTYTDKNNFKGYLEFSQSWKGDLQEFQEQFYKTIFANLPESQKPMFEDDIFTPHTVRELTEEIIREQCFECLEQEVPYSISVKIRKFDESESMPKIYADIMVLKESHKSIVVGSGGKVIKEIGSKARKAIEDMIGMQVFLKLQVVHKDWVKNTMLMKELGYTNENNKK